MSDFSPAVFPLMPKFTLRTLFIWIYVLTIFFVMNITPRGSGYGWPFQCGRYDYDKWGWVQPWEGPNLIVDRSNLSANVAIAIIVAAVVAWGVSFALRKTFRQ
jgi:hypothetical protein